jgi:hypothetical protein
MDIEKWHPKLTGKDYKIVQIDEVLEYFNCIAFVLDIYKGWYGSSTKYWPSDISRVPVLENYVKYFKTFGYDVCENDKYEQGFEKIAIYINKNKVTHTAKQFNDKWRSKLGGSVIIEHELEWLTGYDADNYGEIGVIMKRKTITV